MTRAVVAAVLALCSIDAYAESPPPHLLLEQLSRMTGKERGRIFSKLPPKRREVLEQRLTRYAQLPPAVKAQLREEYNHFLQLPPEKQEQVRTLFRQFSTMDDGRRRSLRRELTRLRKADAEQTAARMRSEQFRAEFSEAERAMLEQLLALLPK